MMMEFKKIRVKRLWVGKCLNSIKIKYLMKRLGKD
jgi:hypothetical protein